MAVRLVLIFTSLTALASVSRASSFKLEWIGEISTFSYDSTAYGISADGRVVFGEASEGSGNQAFRWTRDEGITNLGRIPPSGYSGAKAASTDGSTIVGYNSAAPALHWKEGVGLGVSGLRIAHAVSGDGSIVGGSDVNFDAALWSKASGVVPLPRRTDSESASVRGISTDGSVVVGIEFREGVGQEAILWDSNGNLLPLGFLPGGDSSAARAVSGDGAVVVGHSNSDVGTQAFRWTVAGGMVGLGGLPGEDLLSVAEDVSNDGSVIVGQSKFGDGRAAVVWTAEIGMVRLQDLLESHGVTVREGWTLRDAVGISADGRTIVGEAVGPVFGKIESQSWVATIPEPATMKMALVAASGLFGLACRRRVRRLSANKLNAHVA